MGGVGVMMEVSVGGDNARMVVMVMVTVMVMVITDGSGVGEWQWFRGKVTED